MEEDGIVGCPALIVRHERLVRVSILLVYERDGRSRVAGGGGRVVAQLRQRLGRVRVRRVLRGATSRDDEVGQGEVEDLVRVGE